MFSGIITHIGKLVDIEDRDGVRRFTVASEIDHATLDIGASVCHSGVCLTVVEKVITLEGACAFITEAVAETLDKTNLGRLTIGDSINLELSLKYGDEIGGHFVSGHVDGLADVVAITPFGGGHTVRFKPPEHLQHFVAEKGSVALEGASLTVAKLHDNQDFDICIIPHTWAVTSFGQLTVGDKVNFEVDPLARYVERILGHIPKASGIE